MQDSLLDGNLGVRSRSLSNQSNGLIGTAVTSSRLWESQVNKVLENELMLHNLGGTGINEEDREELRPATGIVGGDGQMSTRQSVGLGIMQTPAPPVHLDPQTTSLQADEHAGHAFLPAMKTGVQWGASRAQAEYEYLAAADRDQAQAFIMELGYMLTSTGHTAHAVEYDLLLVAAKFRIEAFFVSMPSIIFFTFASLGANALSQSPHCTMLRVQPAPTSLRKQRHVHHIARKVMTGSLSIADGINELEQERLAPANKFFTKWPLLSVPVTCIFSMMVAGLSGGGWVELGAAVMAGLVLSLLRMLSQFARPVAQGLEIIAAVCVSAFAVIWNRYVSGVDINIVFLAGTVLLFPGGLTLRAISEMASGNSVAGTPRLFQAVMAYVLLTIGFQLGMKLQTVVDGQAHLLVKAPEWVDPFFIVGASCCLALLLDAPGQHLPHYVVTNIAAFYASRYGSVGGGAGLGGFCGACLVTLMSNAWSKVKGDPATELATVALLIMVPGAAGAEGVIALASGDTASAYHFLMQMLEVILAMFVGTFTGNIILPPRTAVV